MGSLLMITNDYEAYLFVQKHLLGTMEKSMDGNNDCVYRGHKESTIAEALIESENTGDLKWLLSKTIFDAKCAAGCLISDEHYKSDFEGKLVEQESIIWDSIVMSNPKWEMTEHSFQLVRQLQSIHDNNDVSEWELELSRLNLDFDKNQYKPEDRYEDIEEEKDGHNGNV